MRPLNGVGLELETSGFVHQRSYHLSYQDLRWWPSQKVN
jgi:hypothetical protein